MTKNNHPTVPTSYGCRHLAIILDGNGRWAKRRLSPRIIGHRAGANRIKDIVKVTPSFGIEYLTLFVFSIENWSRPEQEVNFLMNLLLSFLEKETQELHQNHVKLSYIGNWQTLSPSLVEKIQYSIDLTKENKGLNLCIALNYGSQDEIISATKRIAQEALAGKINLDTLDRAQFESYLDAPDFPPVDLLIRSSGEKRLSNFLLWQLAYAELYFTKVLWPDFDTEQLTLALQEFSQRDRRFGGISEEEMI